MTLVTDVRLFSIHFTVNAKDARHLGKAAPKDLLEAMKELDESHFAALARTFDGAVKKHCRGYGVRVKRTSRQEFDKADVPCICAKRGYEERRHSDRIRWYRVML